MSSFVCLMDILGFKSLIEENSFEKIIKIYKDMILPLYETAMTRSMFDEINGKIIPRIEAVEFHSTMISDTFVFWTSNTDEIRVLIKFLGAIRSLLKRTMLLGIPLRGAVSMGEIFHHKREYQTPFLNSTNVIIGKPIIECYQLEKKQLWSGCVIDQPCIKLLQTHPQWQEGLDLIKYLEKKKFICNYPVPYKNEEKKKGYVINWVPADNYPINGDQIKNSFFEHNKKIEESSSAEKILSNTIEFYNFNLKIFKDSLVGNNHI